jgi:hypothetical protein
LNAHPLTRWLAQFRANSHNQLFSAASLVTRDVLSVIIEKHVPVAVVVPPRGNLLNGLPKVDMLVLADPSRLMHGRALKKDLSRIGVFNPAGQIGMHHGKPPFCRTG